MKRRNCVRTAVVLAAAVAGVEWTVGVARGDLTPLNEFAINSGGFFPFSVGAGGPTGEVVAIDQLHQTGEVFSSDGTFRYSLSDGPGGFQVSMGSRQPIVGPDGTVYVANQTEPWSIGEFANNTGVGDGGIGPALTGAYGIAMASNGSFFVSNNSAIDVLSATGQLLETYTGGGNIGSATEIALDSSGENLYIADSSNNRVDVISSAGTFETTLGGSVLSDPTGVAVSATGLIYVADKNDGIKVFNTGGTLVETIGATLTADSLAITPNGLLYNANVGAIYRYLDPASWASGTNTFTNPNTGPTSVAVGSGQLLGTDLTLNSNMGLDVGATTTVNDGGVLTLNGGTLTTSTLVVDGTTSGASFTETSGTLSASTVSVTNGGVADFVGSPLSVVLSGSVSISGATSQFKVDQGATFSATSLSIASGQIVAGTNADLIVYSGFTNNGTINLAGGELDVRGTLTNSSIINGSGTLSTTTGLMNNAQMHFTGPTNILGGVTNNSAGTIEFSGTQPNSLFAAVVNAGTITIDAGSTATFYGGISGPGQVINNGLLMDQAVAVTSVGTVSGSGNLVVGDSHGDAAAIIVSSLAQNSVMVQANSKLTILGGGADNVVDSLSVATGGVVDVTNSHFFIKYGNGPDPIGSIAALIKSGYEGGAWNGAGIDSSAAAENAANYGIGFADSADAGNPAGLSSGTIEIKYTLLGDANLSGVVDGTDFGIVAANFNKGVTGWDEGDFNYDGVVDGSDFGDLAVNFNKGASGAAAVEALDEFAAAHGLLADVPEPMTFVPLCLVGFGWLARRRGRKLIVA